MEQTPQSARPRTGELVFSAKTIDRLPPAGKDKRDVYRDRHTHGLTLRVTDTGAKSFAAVTWSARRHKPERITLGPYPALTVERARELCRAAVDDIKAGVSRVEAKAALAGAPTLGEVFERYLTEKRDRSGRGLSEWTRESHRYLWQRYFAGQPINVKGSSDRTGPKGAFVGPDLASRKVSTLGAEDFRAVIEKMATAGISATAGRARSLAQAVCTFARKRKIWPDAPRLGEEIDPFGKHRRERPIQDRELGALFAQLEHESADIRDAVLLMLLTGLRRSNVEGCKWQWVDFDTATISVPVSDFKTKVAFTAALVEPALRILVDRRKRIVAGEFVFPRQSNPRAHWELAHTTWRRVLKDAGLNDLRIHDLRHACGQTLTRLGVPQALHMHVLGHSSLAASSRYQQMNTTDTREALSKVATRYAEIGRAHGADVVPISRGRRRKRAA